MGRWTGSWLSGPRAALEPDEREDQDWPGQRLGLPERGPGSVAGRGVRFVAFLADVILASLVTMLFVRVDFADPAVMQVFNYWAALVWFTITVIAVSLFGISPGKALLGVRVVRMDGASMVGPFRAIPRTLLVALLIPAAISDRDGRSLNDKAVGTIVVRFR